MHEKYTVAYGQRPNGKVRVRKERWEKVRAGLRKWGWGAVILCDYDFHRYMGHYSYHLYAYLPRKYG